MPKTDPLARDLVRLALDLRRAAPWKRIGADAPFLVRHAGDAHPLAVALGRSSAERGVILARGEHALQDLEEWLGPCPPSLVGPQVEVVILGYEQRAKVLPELLRILEEGGLQARRETLVPNLFAVDRGVRPKTLNRGQLRSMVAALRAVLLADRDGRLRPPAGREARILELALEGRGRRAQVADRIVHRPEARRTHAPTPAATPPRNWISRLRVLPRLDETWVVGTMNWSVSVVGEDRILVPLTVVDVDSHLILASEIVSAGVVAELFTMLTAVFRGEAEAPGPEEERFGLPRAIVFVEPWYRDVLGNALEAIGIEVSVEPEHPVFVEVRLGFVEMLTQVDPLSGEPEA